MRTKNMDSLQESVRFNDFEKVTIVAPVGVPMKMYSMQAWIAYLDNHYPNNEVVLCANGTNQLDVAKGVMELKDFLNRASACKKRYRMYVLNDEKQYTSTPEKRIALARNFLVSVTGDDDLFWLDTDVIPHISDPIQRLLSHKVPCVSGIYLYKKTKVPVACGESGTNFTMTEMRNAVIQDKLLDATGFGFGLVLTRRCCFKHAHFDADGMTGEDIYFCEMLRKVHKLYVDALVIAAHVSESDFASKKDNSKKHWEMIASLETDERVYPLKFSKMLEYANKVPSHSVVDFGCYKGTFLKCLYEDTQGRRKLTGIDQIKLTFDERFQYIQTDIREENMKLHEYDLAVASDVIEHFTDDELPKVLRNIYNSIRSRGHLIVTVPYKCLGDHPEHHQEFDIDSLKDVLSEWFESVEYEIVTDYELPSIVALFQKKCKKRNDYKRNQKG